MKKVLLTVATAGLLSASMVMSVFATTVSKTSEGGAKPYREGTDVYAGVIVDDPDAKIRVMVPTLFAFVVNGSVDGSATEISVENGSLLLPNMKVDVDTEDGQTTNHNYSIQTVGSGEMYFENRSTVKVADASGDYREGIPVNIKGSIKNEGTNASRNYWEHVGTKPTSAKEDFKKYQLVIDGQPFSEADIEDGSFGMADGINLLAPELGYDSVSKTYTNLDEETNFAKVGSREDANFSVNVGGTRGDYKQVEESAKVGTIVWTISYDIKNSDIKTAPDNEFLEKATTAP